MIESRFLGNIKQYLLIYIKSIDLVVIKYYAYQAIREKFSI